MVLFRSRHSYLLKTGCQSHIALRLFKLLQVDLSWWVHTDPHTFVHQIQFSALIPHWSSHNDIFANGQNFLMDSHCEFVIFVKHILDDFKKSTRFIMVDEKQLEIRWDELLARMFCQLRCYYSIALLLAHDSQCFFVAIERLTQFEWQKEVWLVFEVDPSWADLIMSSTRRVNHDICAPKAFQKVSQFDPELTFR